MNRSVLKFGGSSVSDFTKIKNIAEMLKTRVEQGEELIVVVSAMGKTTDQLMENVSTLTSTPKDQELAYYLLRVNNRQSPIFQWYLMILV